MKINLNTMKKQEIKIQIHFSALFFLFFCIALERVKYAVKHMKRDEKFIFTKLILRN